MRSNFEKKVPPTGQKILGPLRKGQKGKKIWKL